MSMAKASFLNQSVSMLTTNLKTRQKIRGSIVLDTELNGVKTKKPKHKIPEKVCKDKHRLSLGQRLADKFASVVGSWKFILIQTLLMAIWILLNIACLAFRWDPYPFILLNLFLSCQAAYTGPVIMMSQNRQSEVDRETMYKDYELSEKSLKLLQQITKAFKHIEEDRVIFLKLLKDILEEVEDVEVDREPTGRQDKSK
jgi:uncharacterized membrane protein